MTHDERIQSLGDEITEKMDEVENYLDFILGELVSESQMDRIYMELDKCTDRILGILGAN